MKAVTIVGARPQSIKAAAKVHLPVAHVRAGPRRFNRAMPEEINGAVANHLSHLLLCLSQTSIDDLRAESITRGVHLFVPPAHHPPLSGDTHGACRCVALMAALTLGRWDLR